MTVYRFITDDYEDDLPDPDLLWVALAALPNWPSRTYTINTPSVPGRFIQLTMAADGSLTVRHRPSAAAQTTHTPGHDLLDVHQWLLGCTSMEPPWPDIATTYATSPDIDYAPTGLTIASAMLDHSRRGFDAPLHWGPHRVITGDTWPDIPSPGRVLITVESIDENHPHGIALRFGTPPEHEAWPTTPGEQFDYPAPHPLLQLTNIYRTGPSTTDRWSGNAGMLASQPAPDVRTYRCNHPATTPPAFTDLVFTVRVTPP